MDLTQLPAPPDNLVTNWEQLPDYFKACVEIIYGELGIATDVKIWPLTGPADESLNPWLAEIRPNRESTSKRSLNEAAVIEEVGTKWKILIPGGFDEPLRQLLLHLFAAPFEGHLSGTMLVDVADWLYHLIFYLDQGHYRT